MAIHELGLPTPEPQVEVWHCGVLLGRVDFLWRDQRTVGEAEGMSKYVEPAFLRSEKRRQEALEDVGLEVVRWSWQDSYRDTSRLGERLRRVPGGAGSLGGGEQDRSQARGSRTCTAPGRTVTLHGRLATGSPSANTRNARSAAGVTTRARTIDTDG